MKRDIDEVEVLIEDWADWMRRPELPEGPKVAVGFMKGTLKDSEEMYEAADLERISRIDAAFDSLTPIYREAIMRKYGLGARVWRFGREVSFDEAKEQMRAKLILKGVL